MKMRLEFDGQSRCGGCQLAGPIYTSFMMDLCSVLSSIDSLCFRSWNAWSWSPATSYFQGFTRRASGSEFDDFAVFNINRDAPKDHLPRFTRRITAIP